MRLPALMLLGFALAFAGCGGDDEPDQASDSRDSTLETQQDSVSDSEPQPGSSEEEEADTESAEDGEPAGGSGDESSDPPPALSRAEYIKRADGICRAARNTLGDRGDDLLKVARALLRKKISRDEYFRRSAALTEDSAAAAAAAVAEIEDLPRPADRRDALERYLQATALQVDYFSAQADALRAGRSGEVARLNRRLTATGSEVKAAARQFGFNVCGSD